MKKLLPIIGITLLCLWLSSLPAVAVSLSGDDYDVDQGHIHLGAPTTTPITVPGPQIIMPSPAGPKYSEYTITLPKPSNNASDFFGIQTDTTLIDYGPLSPADPIVRQLSLATTPGKSFGYGVLAYEESSLRSDGGDTIPDTSCDQGSCTESVASVWESVLSYGLGYHCVYIDGFCNDFNQSDMYKRFVKTSPTLSGLLGRKDREESMNTSIQLKLNTATTQKDTEYTNKIIFLAVPRL